MIFEVGKFARLLNFRQCEVAPYRPSIRTMEKKLTRPVLLKTILTIGIAVVWLANGLFCKVLNLVPRHQLIVSRILGEEYSVAISKTIGILEILMFAWILSGIKSRICALTQIVVIAAMNVIEFILAPDLLLFGRLNLLIAVAFILIIFLTEFFAGRSEHQGSYKFR